MSAWGRTIVVLVVVYTWSVCIVRTAPFPALIGRRPMIGYARVLARIHRWTTRWILGIRTRVEGTRPDAPVLYAAKHQAMFETIEFALMLDAPALVMKAELARIPIWGWAARRYGIIVIDRESSGAGLRRLMREAQATLAKIGSAHV